MWLVAKETKLSFPQIGRLFNRDHSTVLHAVWRVDAIKGEVARVRKNPPRAGA
jgi:chromosomal replication initiation ATPase DnaA